MDIRQLKAFVAIADTRTFTAGAERVHVTQAAISMQIKLLEEEVGVKLFTRTPRRAMLTEAGERLIVRARSILREHDAALAELAELAGAERGRLRIGSASAMVSSEHLPDLLLAVREQHPNAEISVASGTSDALVKSLLAGDLDVAFVSLPVQAVGVETELLSQDELIAIANPRHPLAHNRVITAEALGKENLILGEKGGNTRRLIDEFFEAQSVRPQVAMELSSQAAIKRMVETEMGVGIVPARTAQEEIAKGRLVGWWIRGATINWELGLARLRGGYDAPIIETFLRLCREEFKQSRKSKGESRKQKK